LSDPVLSLRDVRLSLAGRPVLHGVDLEVAPGEFVALLGANGSGKSTLVRAATGLRPLSSGSVRLFGTPLHDFRDWSRIGFVPQRSSAVSGVSASVWEVVASGRLGHRRLFRRLSAADRRAIADALDVVGLSDRSRESVGNLSGGQQQRVLIARALTSRPDLLVMDEPTAGVDLANQLALASTLSSLKERGLTLILVAHELGPLAGLMDRAIVMRDGRIAYDGGPLADHAVHSDEFGESHSHHCDPETGLPVLDVRSPWEVTP
jgi:zinc transport system ATP-binding protein